jgi:hypothetical protein
LGISKLVVQSDELGDVRVIDELRESEQVIWLTRQADELPSAVRSDDTILHLPGAGLTRMSQLKLALLLSLMNKEMCLSE